MQVKGQALKAHVQDALWDSRRLLSEPEGPPYFFDPQCRTSDYNALRRLGVLGGPKNIAKAGYFDTWLGGNHRTYMYPVNYARGRAVLDQLAQLEKLCGPQFSVDIDRLK